MDNYVKNPTYPEWPELCLGIFFQEATEDQFDIIMRYNITKYEFQSDLYPTSWPRIIDYGVCDMVNLMLYKRSGIYTIHNWISNHIINKYGSGYIFHENGSLPLPDYKIYLLTNFV